VSVVVSILTGVLLLRWISGSLSRAGRPLERCREQGATRRLILFRFYLEFI